jgi:hypothetical protein
MPQGEGTYGNQVGRPVKKTEEDKEEDSSTDGKTLLTSKRKPKMEE